VVEWVIPLACVSFRDTALRDVYYPQLAFPQQPYLLIFILDELELIT
jgi:hypothetical protein